MKPAKVAEALRQIASKIDASKNPDRQLVSSDLQKLHTIISNDLPEDNEDESTMTPDEDRVYETVIRAGNDGIKLGDLVRMSKLSPNSRAGKAIKSLLDTGVIVKNGDMITSVY